MDLVNQLPVDSDRFDTLIQSMELNGISVVDLLIQPNSTLSKRLNRSITEIEQFQDLLTTVSQPIDLMTHVSDQRRKKVKTGIKELDKQLRGGLGGLVEIYGESGTGKSQMLYQIVANSSKSVYITTEKFLETKRLEEIIISNNKTNRFNCSLEDIDYIYCSDLEVQHHILFSQLPHKLSTEPVQTVIIDSIGHHLRHEGLSNTNFLKHQIKQLESELDDINDPDFYQSTKTEFYQQYNRFFKVHKSYDSGISKKFYIYKLYHHLNKLIQDFGVTIVVANQISEQIADKELSPLDLNYQMGGIVGWDESTIGAFQSAYSKPNSNSSTADLSHSLTQGEMSLTEIENQVNDILNNKNADSSREINAIINRHHRRQITKFQIPSLGYNWMKNISTRILLLKSYKPIVSDDVDKLSSQKNEEFNEDYVKHRNRLSDRQTNNDNDDTNNSKINDDNENDTDRDDDKDYKRRKLNPISIKSLIDGWEVKRYVKLSPDYPLIKFQITTNGLL